MSLHFHNLASHPYYSVLLEGTTFATQLVLRYYYPAVKLGLLVEFIDSQEIWNITTSSHVLI